MMSCCKYKRQINFPLYCHDLIAFRSDKIEANNVVHCRKGPLRTVYVVKRFRQDCSSKGAKSFQFNSIQSITSDATAFTMVLNNFFDRETNSNANS